MSINSTMAAITTAARVASGSWANNAVRKSRVTMVRPATTMPDIWLFAPAEPFTAVLERLPLTTIPPLMPDPRFVRPDRSTPDRIDLVMMLAAYVLPAPRPSAKPTNITPSAAGAIPSYGHRVASGSPSEGDRTRSRRRWTLRVRRGRTGPRLRSPKMTAMRGPGARADTHDRRRRWQDTRPHGHVGRWVSSRLLSHAHSSSKKSPSPPSMPNSLGSCPR